MEALPHLYLLPLSAKRCWTSSYPRPGFWKASTRVLTRVGRSLAVPARLLLYACCARPPADPPACCTRHPHLQFPGTAIWWCAGATLIASTGALHLTTPPHRHSNGLKLDVKTGKLSLWRLFPTFTFTFYSSSPSSRRSSSHRPTLACRHEAVPAWKSLPCQMATRSSCACWLRACSWSSG